MEKKSVNKISFFDSLSLTLPSSKSLTQRALLCASLVRGKSLIKNPLLSEDPLLLKGALSETGVKFTTLSDNTLEVEGMGGEPLLNQKRIYLGNNGTGARFFLAYASLGKGEWLELYGKERLHERPMAPLINVLRKLGAKIECLKEEGHFPLKVYQGTLSSDKVTLPGNISSQFISALLIIGSYLPKGLEIVIEGDLLSKGYVEMTCEVMSKFGLKVEREGNHYVVERGEYKATTYEVPADTSSASYFLAIPLVLGKGKVRIENFDYHTKQADILFLNFLEEMGAQIKPLIPLGLEVSFEGRPKGGSFNLKDCPDLFPTLAILGAVAEGRTILYGAPHLRFKETDRIKAMAKELSKLKVRVEEIPDGLIIYGQESFVPAQIATYDDHRIAMAFAILALKAGPLEINNPQCVTKSFPNFWELFEKIYEKNSPHRL